LPAVLASGVLGAGAVALGVTLARWSGSLLAPIVAIVAVGFLSAKSNTIGDKAWATDRLLGTFVLSPPTDPIFVSGHWWARLAWLASISVLVAAIGLLGSRVTGVRVVAGLAALIALSAGLLVVRPASSHNAQRIAGLVAAPLEHEVCE